MASLAVRQDSKIQLICICNLPVNLVCFGTAPAYGWLPVDSCRTSLAFLWGLGTHGFYLCCSLPACFGVCMCVVCVRAHMYACVLNTDSFSYWVQLFSRDSTKFLHSRVISAFFELTFIFILIGLWKEREIYPISQVSHFKPKSPPKVYIPDVHSGYSLGPSNELVFNFFLSRLTKLN